MESRTIKKGLRTYMSKKSSFLLRFIFIFFVFILIAFHLYKYAARNPGFLGSNVLEFPDFPFSVSISESVAKPAMIQHKKKTDLIIENTVMFSDFVLVVLTTDSKAVHLQNVAENRIDCVYKTQLTGPDDFLQENNVITYPMLSADEHDAGESRWMVRCPLPPANHSAAVGLQVHQDQVAEVATENQTGLSWGNKLVYEAAFDGEETVAVFIKGLGLNGEKKSKPGQFKCRFGEDFKVITKAITAAQEVIRCPLPQGVTKSSIAKNNDAVQVTIERAINSKPHGESYIVDSIAKLQKSNEVGRIQGKINKHELCACTMVWNQAAFLREWIIYHSWLGIQRWFVYDNNSDDGLKDVIDDLNIENYNVSSHSWPWLKSQEAGFAHCLLRARDECSWIAFFDVDEFYYFPTPKKQRPSTIIDHPGRNSLRKIVQNVTSLPLKGQVKTNCFNFGPSGLKVSPVEGVSSGYTCRLKIYDRHKSIVRPDAVDDSLLNRIHHFELKKGLSGKTLDLTTAVINHYKYQVWDDFKMKFVRRVSAYVPDWTDNKDEESKDRTPGLGTEAIEPEDWDKKFCEVWDTGLRDFIRKNLGDPNTTLLPWQRSKS